MIPLNQSAKYRKFISDRDKALEKIHANAQKEISYVLHTDYLTRILEIVSFQYGLIPQADLFTARAQQAYSIIQHRIESAAYSTAHKLLEIILRMRRTTFVLSSLAETEAVAQATSKPITNDLDKNTIRTAEAKNATDESIIDRIQLALNRIKRDVMDALEISKTHSDSAQEAIERVTKSFPKPVVYSRPPVELKRLREAEGETKFKIALGRVNCPDEDWNDVLQMYTGPAIPSTRFYNEPIDVDIGDPELEIWYSWEIEQQLTHDFVDKVRAGQVEAFQKAGIKDFVWVAQLDERTCTDCCAWRDGLLISEIRAELNGKHKHDECESEIPPAHFNCRCALAPVGEVPERVEPNLQEFEEWLET